MFLIYNLDDLHFVPHESRHLHSLWLQIPQKISSISSHLGCKRDGSPELAQSRWPESGSRATHAPWWKWRVEVAWSRTAWIPRATWESAGASLRSNFQTRPSQSYGNWRREFYRFRCSHRDRTHVTAVYLRSDLYLMVMTSPWPPWICQLQLTPAG